MPLSKFEANTTRLKCAYFSLFPLASSCSNDSFSIYMYVRDNFLANRLVFLNMVTYTTFRGQKQFAVFLVK